MKQTYDPWRWQGLARREFKVVDTAETSTLFPPKSVSIYDYIASFVGYLTLIGLIYLWTIAWQNYGFSGMLWDVFFTVWVPWIILAMTGKVEHIELREKSYTVRIRFGLIIRRNLKFRHYKKRRIKIKDVGRYRHYGFYSEVKRRPRTMFVIKDRLARKMNMICWFEKAPVILAGLEQWNAPAADFSQKDARQLAAAAFSDQTVLDGAVLRCAFRNGTSENTQKDKQKHDIINITIDMNSTWPAKTIDAVAATERSLFAVSADLRQNKDAQNLTTNSFTAELAACWLDFLPSREYDIRV